MSDAFAHAGNADTEMSDIGLGLAIGGKFHTAAEVGDLENNGRRSFEEADTGGSAAGMALNIGETLLNDAEEGDFDELGQAAEMLGKDELSFDTAAVTEAMDVFLESGDQAEFIQQGRMKEIREGADFTRHMLEQGASLFEGVLRRFAEGRGGLADLGEAQVDRKNGLREAIVEFAANAAALFILEIEELGGELTDGVLGVLHLGDIGERGNDAEDGAIEIELGDGVAENPEDFRRAGTPPTHGGVADGELGAKDGSHWAVREGYIAALLIDRDETRRGDIVANLGKIGNSKHVESGLIGELDFAVRTVEYNTDVEVADEGAETLFAFAEGVESFALFGDVGERGEDASEIPGGIKFRNGVEEGPRNFIPVRKAPSKDLVANRLSGGNDSGGGAGGFAEGGTVFEERLKTKFLRGLADNISGLESEHVQGGLICELHACLRIERGDPDVKVLDERAEALFVGAEQLFRGLALGDVANDDQGTRLTVEIEQSAGHVPNADEAWFRAKTELAFLKFARAHEFRENLRSSGRVFPEAQIGGSFLQNFLAGVAGEAREAVVDVNIAAVGEKVDGHGIGAGAKSGGEHAL